MNLVREWRSSPPLQDSGEFTMVSVWLYLYGPDGANAAKRDDPLWRAWLAGLASLSG